MIGTYKTYEIPNEKALLKCKRVIWRGLFNRTEGIGVNKKIFISVNIQGFNRIKRAYPFMKIKEVVD